MGSVRKMREDEVVIPPPGKSLARKMAPDEETLKPAAGAVNTLGVASPSASVQVGKDAIARLRAERAGHVNHLTRSLGPRYDPESTFSDGMSGFWTSADMARSHRLSDKQKKFKAAYPDGSVINVPTPGGLTLLARKSREEPFRELPMGPTVAGTVVSEPFMLGTLGSLLGPKGTFAGTTAGVLLQDAAEEQRGFGDGVSVGSALKEGGTIGAIDVFMRGGMRLFAGRQRLVSEVDAMKEALEGVEALGLEPLAIGQLGGGPYERGIFKQVGATSPRIETLTTKQAQALLNLFERLGDNAPATNRVIMDIIRAQRDELSRILTPKGLLRADAGALLKKGEEVWKRATRIKRNRLYDEAHALSDDVTYDVNGLQDVNRNLAAGVRSAEREGVEQAERTTAKEVTEHTERGGEVISERTIDEGTRLADGVKHSSRVERRIPAEGEETVITRHTTDTLPEAPTATAEGGVRVSGNPASELEAVMRDIERLEPQVSRFASESGEWTAFEQIQALRTRLFDLKSSDDGGTRRAANILWRELTKVMDNPISGDPAFVEAHRTARAFNRFREDTLEKTFVGQALATDTPEAIAARYFRPGNATALKTIQGMLSPRRFEQFREGFQLDIANARTARQGLTRLENFRATDPDGLGILLKPQEERALKEYLARKMQFEASPAAKLMEKELAEGEKLLALAEKGTAGEVEGMVRLGGGIDSAYAQAARAGVFKSILNNARDLTVKGVEVLDPKSVLRQITAWKNSGKLDSLFRPEDWRTLTQIEKYTAPLAESADIGGGMMAGSTRQQGIQAVTDVLEGASGAKKVLKGVVRTLIGNDVMAWLLSRPARSVRATVQSTMVERMKNIGVALSIEKHMLDKQSAEEVGFK
jgi:hypothetical protein